MKFFLRIFFFFVVFLGLASSSMGDEMIMARSEKDFADTMNILERAIVENGYTVTRVQRVDVGLEAKGYLTDKYRVVFYGKGDEIAALADRYPQLIPYLPLSIGIFAEGDQTLITTGRPRALKALFPEKDLQPTFERWDYDLLDIFEAVRQQL